MNKAVFLDRDGVICKDVNYLDNVNDLQILPGVAEAIQMLNNHQFKVIVITNQSGIARKFFDLDTLNEIHDTMTDELGNDGARIDKIYYCPHHPDEQCQCRKPNSELFYQAQNEFDIDFSRSFMIGDRSSDIDAGKRIGCQTVFIVTDSGSKIHEVDEPDYIAQDLLEATNWILQQSD